MERGRKCVTAKEDCSIFTEQRDRMKPPGRKDSQDDALRRGFFLGEKVKKVSGGNRNIIAKWKGDALLCQKGRVAKSSMHTTTCNAMKKNGEERERGEMLSP